MAYDYYEDRRWCPKCTRYVAYLLSPHDAWCVSCGAKVRLFSDTESREFHHSLRSPALRREFESESA